MSKTRTGKLLKVKDTYHEVHYTKDGGVYIDLFDKQGVKASTVEALVRRLAEEFGCDVLLVDEKDVSSPK
jgi:hypothetical protein